MIFASKEGASGKIRDAGKLLQTRRLRPAAASRCGFLGFSSSLNTGRRWQGAQGCELCFRDKGYERKGG